jgi:hypothetical protein
LAGLSMLVALAGCGGGGGGGAEPASAAPAVIAVTAPLPGASVSGGTLNTATAAYGVLGTPTARVALVPAPSGVVPVLIGQAAGANATVTWGKGVNPAGVTPTVSASFTVSACSVDSAALKAVCIGYGSPRVLVLDLARFAETLQVLDVGKQEIDSGAGNTPVVFSGAGCIVCGVATDAGQGRFIIGGVGGFRVFGYGSATATARYDIPVGENFAFLPRSDGHSLIIAPEYATNAGQRVLRVVDLADGVAYAWTRHTDSLADLGSEAANFAHSEVDAAAVDPATGLVVLTTEDSADFLLVDLAAARFDRSAMTFDAPFSLARPAAGPALGRLTDAAVSASGSLLLSHGEGDSVIGVTPLPTTGGTRAGALGVVALNDPALDRSACGGSGFVFAGKGDPHGLSLYTDLGGAQQGLVINQGNTCAAIVDLAGLRDAPRLAGDANRIDTAVPGVAALVRFVSLI